jgi:hypothetical protein
MGNDACNGFTNSVQWSHRSFSLAQAFAPVGKAALHISPFFSGPIHGAKGFGGNVFPASSRPMNGANEKEGTMVDSFSIRRRKRLG